MSETTRFPDLPLHSESGLVILVLQTDFENTDLALVQLEKSHIAGTFCTGVKSAQYQCGGVNTAASLSSRAGDVDSEREPESEPAALLLQPHFCTAGACCQHSLSCHLPASCPHLQN